jgi:hypothetical protein
VSIKYALFWDVKQRVLCTIETTPHSLLANCSGRILGAFAKQFEKVAISRLFSALRPSFC